MKELFILTPVYNGARWLEACIENVARQWVPGITHWIIDGGSSDGSKEILLGLSQKYPHLRFLSEPDRGQSDAMNKAIRLAGEAWIGFLNVDDYYESSVLSGVLNRIQSQSMDCLLVGNLRVIDENARILRINRPSQMSFSALLADMCEWPFNPSAYFYPARLHQKIGYFPEDEHFAMDYDFILRIMLHKVPVVYVDEIWGNFRLLPEAKTGQDQADQSSYFRALALREKYSLLAPPSVRLESKIRKVYWAVRNKLYGLINSK